MISGKCTQLQLNSIIYNDYILPLKEVRNKLLFKLVVYKAKVKLLTQFDMPTPTQFSTD